MNRHELRERLETAERAIAHLNTLERQRKARRQTRADVLWVIGITALLLAIAIGAALILDHVVTQ